MTFSLAFLIGLSVASIPGPTIILVATETLKKGAKAGVITMTAPILMDALFMLPLGLLVQTAFFSGRAGLILGLAGASFLAWLGVRSIQSGATRLRHATLGLIKPGLPESQELSSFVKAILTHLTSPYPYLYWGTVGSTFVRRDFAAGGARQATLFPLGFWSGAAAFTLLVIFLLARGKKLLPLRLEPYVHHFSGALLIGSGFFLAIAIWRGFF